MTLILRVALEIPDADYHAIRESVESSTFILGFPSLYGVELVVQRGVVTEVDSMEPMDPLSMDVRRIEDWLHAAVSPESRDAEDTAALL
ncbi:hypothetical protein [Thioalkalivibrio sp. ALE16]|uniref:hypothetical protein n=1 Tax=Thioalkalivibrio sp. ALE16 TaxID=1158172 RepID=UPI00037CC63A|nr:hypothetical protein [Thioalkalivibrio sp. ALE16]